MKYSTLARSLLVIPLVLLVNVAMATKNKVPDEEGFSGNILVGAGYIDLENSYVAGNKLIDVKNRSISGYGSPSSESDSYPFFTGEVDYTFGDHWQAFFGSELEDLAQLDMVQRLGIRKQWDGVGVMGGAVLLSSIPGEVWTDPYQLNSSRSDTNRDSTGVQFDWYQILESNFFLELNTRKIDINTEKSGTSEGLTAAQIDSLRRDGTDSRLTVGYRWKNGDSIWQPEITAGNDDRDGNAVSRDVMNLKLNYTYLGEVWTTAASLAYVDYQYDEVNPIFNQRTDADGYAASLSMQRKLDMGDGNWSVVGNLVYANVDSKVNFNDTTVTGINAGVNYSFGK